MRYNYRRNGGDPLGSAEVMGSIDASDVEDERATAEFGVAELIASLAEATETPTEFEPSDQTYRAEDIDFEGRGWMGVLAKVQGWLRLTEQLELDEPEQFIASLLRSLGFEDPADGCDAGDQLRLSDVALDRLRERLDRALDLQERFNEDLTADGGSRKSASGRWREAWEDEPDEELDTSPISAEAKTWKIDDFSYRAATGKLNLSPSYQRGDVWPTKDSQMLIESILRGIPLPSVIILQPSETDRPFEIVDGKQRLTAILRFMGKHPRALEKVREEAQKHQEVELEKLFETDYPKFRRAWKNVVGEQLTASLEREYYFPFKLRKDAKSFSGLLAPLEGMYYTDIKDHTIQIAGETASVYEVFEKTTKYSIPVIVYTEASRRQIHNVFNLYNKQGKHLNAEEIRNALYHDLGLMRALIVASGDIDDVESVAPFLSPVWESMSAVPELLEDYGFGTSRYRRTKVLSWLATLLLFDPMRDGRPKLRSTALQINALLDRVEGNQKDPLRSGAVLRDAFTLLATAIEAHSAIDDAWAPVFKDTDSGTKWQELQLIASLLGVAIATSILGDEVADRLESKATALAALTATKGWRRPEKTQTATQWEFIARIALWILAELDVDLEEASASLVEQFGATCIPALQAISDDAGAS